jgi:hypothetical protein
MLSERIATAQTTGNLGEAKTSDQLADVDVIRACGMVAVKMPLSIALWRWKYAHADEEATEILKTLIELVLNRARAPDVTSATELVGRVVGHWIDTVCSHCDGRGYETMPGTPMLSDKACDHCGGSGHVKFKERSEDELWLLDRLEAMEREAAAAVRKKLCDIFDA